jgi:HEAT repeat protein
MPQEIYHTISALLSSHEPADLQRGLELVQAAAATAGPELCGQLCETIMPLFYIDPLDHPEHVPVIEEAIRVVAGLGEAVIPALIQNLEMGDVKAQMAIAQALGRMGAAAVDPLIAEYHSTCPDPSCRAFLLYALGKVKAPEVVKAAPLAVEAAASSDLELRDTATRALGKFAESIPAGGLSEAVRVAALAALQRNLSDYSPGVRAKAVRSLGKFARHGHLTPREKWELAARLRRILGQDEQFEWDRAYVVRKEAQEALGYVG